MASQNINQYYRPNWSLKLNLDSSDMSLTSDEQDYNQEVVFSPYLIAQTYGDRLPIYFDINNPLSVQNQTLLYKQYNNNNIFVSQNYYNPNNEDLTCYSSSTSCDIGLTGIDNGLVDQMTGETITFTKGLYSDYLKFNRMYYDRRLKLHQVTGHTMSPNVRFSGFNKTVLYEVVSKSSPFEGRYHELYGGFYQGFYKLFGFDYEVFPERMNKGWSVEMVLKPRLFNEHTPLPNETTLNEIYPNNKNTFFYFGTRAENKFYHHASGSPLCFSGYNRVTSGLTELQTCACCNRTITDSRCIFVYPPRSVNNIHDPHVNYGCGSCKGDPQKKITCGCDCNLDPCETCGWECQTHVCSTVIEPTPTPSPTPTPIPDCELPHVCSPSCDVCTPTTTCYNCNTGFTSIENTCETNPIYDSMSNALSFRLCGDPKNPGIGVRMLKFTGDCVTTGSCETSGITYTTGHTIVDYCTPPIYPTCLLENPAWLDEEHWFQVDAVWERYTWLDTCDLWYRGGLGDITEKLYLESLANNASSLITVPYTQIDCKPSEQIELVRLNEKWLIDKLYRNGRLKIYVNGKLFHTIENFEEIIPRGLDTDKEKQVGVPFNISWGGGTQGLRENLTFSSITQPYGPYIQDPENFPINDLSGTTFSGLKTNILIEQNFAGTFDGAISQFRMYVTPLSAPEVKHNFNLLKNIFRMFNPDCPDCSTSVCLPNDFTYKISEETTTTTTTNLTTTTTTTYSPTTTTTTYSPTPTPTVTPNCFNGLVLETIYLNNCSEISLLPLEWQNIGLGGPIPPSMVGCSSSDIPSLGVGGHCCNSAVFEFTSGSISLGESNINNCGGTLTGQQTSFGTYICGDYNNTPAPLTGGVWAGVSGFEGARYSRVDVSPSQAQQLLIQSGGGPITINLNCSKTLYSCTLGTCSCNLEWGGGCHADVTFLRITQGNTLLYAGGIGVDIPVIISPCQTPTPTPTSGLLPTPTPTPTNTSTPTPSPSAGCCTPFTNLELPGGNVFLNGVTLTFSSTQPSGLSIFTLPNIMSPACLPQQQLINCLATAGNNFQDWNYTINFSQPVNNVKIQIINYSSSSAFDNQEKITFTTNTNVPTIFNCDGCNVLVENNSIISNPVPLGGISNGSGTFIISTTTPFNSLTLTPSMLGTNPQGYIVSVFIRICDLTSTPTPTPTSTPTSTPTPTPTVYTPGECIRFIDETSNCSGTIVLPSNINPSAQINGKSSYYFTYFAFASPTLLMRISWDNINNYWVLEDMTTYYPLPDPLAYLPINSPTPIGSMTQWVALPSLIGSCLYGGGSGSGGPLFLTTTGIGDCSPCCKTFQLYSGFGPGTGSTYQILYCDNTVEVIDVPLYVVITYKCAINVIKLNGGGTVTVVDINCDCDPNNLSLFNEQKLGRIFIEDKRDNKYLIQDKLTIPKTTITKKEWDGNVWWGNQGNTPQCVGYAWAHWICDGPITHRGALPIIQPSLIYREAQKVDEWPGERYNGTSVRGGAKYLMSSGKISSYLWAFDINTLINTVLNVGPVVVGTNWYYNMFFPNKNGLIRLSGHIAGGHAYVINGVNTVTKQFRIKNSWGKTWGVSGHAYISFSDMSRLIIERGEICLAIEKPF